MMDINFFLFMVLTLDSIILRRALITVLQLYHNTVCNFQRVNCHFIYIVAVGLYTLILYMSHAAILLQSKLIIPFLTIKRIFFATAITLTCQLPGGLKIIVLESLWTHLLYLIDTLHVFTYMIIKFSVAYVAHAQNYCWCLKSLSLRISFLYYMYVFCWDLP